VPKLVGRTFDQVALALAVGLAHPGNRDLVGAPVLTAGCGRAPEQAGVADGFGSVSGITGRSSTGADA
jgi:hypothetical protein